MLHVHHLRCGSFNVRTLPNSGSSSKTVSFVMMVLNLVRAAFGFVTDLNALTNSDEDILAPCNIMNLRTLSSVSSIVRKVDVTRSQKCDDQLRLCILSGKQQAQ